MLRFLPEQGTLPGSATAVGAEVVAPRQSTDIAETAQREVAALYEERAEEFLRYALGLGRDEELAQDALQEAFMRYFVALCEGAKIVSPRAWIYRVVHNYLLDRMKETQRRKEHRLREAISYQQEQDVEAACFRNEFLQTIQAALTAREYECFRLRTAGMRYQEIAASLNLAPGTVGALIYRSMRKLRTILSLKDGEAS